MTEHDIPALIERAKSDPESLTEEEREILMAAFEAVSEAAHQVFEAIAATVLPIMERLSQLAEELRPYVERRE